MNLVHKYNDTNTGTPKIHDGFGVDKEVLFIYNVKSYIVIYNILKKKHIHSFVCLNTANNSAPVQRRKTTKIMCLPASRRTAEKSRGQRRRKPSSEPVQQNDGDTLMLLMAMPGPGTHKQSPMSSQTFYQTLSLNY